MNSVRLPHTTNRPGRLRLVGTTIIDGTGAEPRRADLDIEDGRITRVGEAGSRRVRGLPTVDLTGMFVMPGFVDTHVHLTMPNDTSDEEERLKFAEEHAFDTAESMRLTIEAGVTTARDLAGLTPGFRNAVARGQIVGPRMHVAITMLSPTGGHADPMRANGSLPGYVDYEPIPSCRAVDSDEEVLKAVREIVRAGADVIKICTTGGISTPNDQPDDLGISEEQVRLIVAELNRRQGQPVAAHAQGNAGALAAVRGGVATLEHGYEMSDELIHEMLAQQTVLVPTLSTLNLSPDPGRRRPELVAKKLEWQTRGRRAAADAIAAGVPVAMGTDAGIHPHGRNLAELAHLVTAGLTPLAAITAGTLTGARVLGLDEHVGSIEVGKLADLVVTEHDPLSDLAALADATAVVAVLQSGRTVKDDTGLFG